MTEPRAPLCSCRDSIDQENNMINLIHDGTLHALVMDQLFLEYQASWNCDLFTVGTIAVKVF